MELGLAGARVVVTGGAANIGRGISLAFAREGARVLLADVDADAADRVLREVADAGAAEARCTVTDLRLPGAGALVARAAHEAFGGIDVLVNNAGWSEPGFFVEQTDRSTWQQTIEVNLYAAIECTQAALASMRTQGAGNVVFISSDSAAGVVRQGIYGATKAGLIALARTVARENGRYGIRANVVAPGLVIPPGDEAVGEHSVWAGGAESLFDESQVDHVLRTQPLRRLTAAADVAHAVVWLASETAARQVTGQVLAVGGGSFMP